MGIVKEPEGVDFVVKSSPYTPEEALVVSAWIKAHKLKVAEEASQEAKLLAEKNRDTKTE